MTQDEIVKLARGYAIEFCREHGVDEQDADDYIQEGILGALEYTRGKTHIQKAFVRATVRGIILDYHKKWTNAGIGGKDAPAMEHIYLSEPVGGVGEDDDELTYEEILAYSSPPRGYGVPDDEGIGAKRMEQLRAVLPHLSVEERNLVEFLYFQGRTQQEVADICHTTQKTIHKREAAVLRKLRRLLGDKGV